MNILKLLYYFRIIGNIKDTEEIKELNISENK